MADFVIVKGKRIALPSECEYDMAARAAFIAKLEDSGSPKATTKATKEEK
jgi:hypothetical protein